ncbi:MAG: sensor histidine kinase [Clostridia bacterium]|nr:sensor histidine kinase [Clostridia bacterium]
MIDYTNPYHILISCIISIAQTALIFMFAMIRYKHKFKPRFIPYFIILGVVSNFVALLSQTFFSSVEVIINTALTAILYLLIFRYIFKARFFSCMVSLVILIILYSISSLGSAMILSVMGVNQLFSDINAYTVGCGLTFAIFTVILLIIKFFNPLNLPKVIRRQVFISNASFLAITIIVIVCNMNYYVKMAVIENKWVILANCALFLYLIYANVNVNISLLKYRDLMDKHIAAVEELAVIKERNRFARDAHDTVGHAMAKVITLLELCRISGDVTDKMSKMLNDASDFAREGLNEVRRSIAGLVPEKLELGNLEGALKKLFSDFTTADINIDFSIEGTIPSCGTSKYSNSIYRICQEALTNSVRHGNAKNVTVILRFGDTIKLFICDDGSGCKDFKKGFGLSGMEQRVKELDGSISYGSNDGEGFNIFAEIPVIRDRMP